jgi:predicted alpha/beta-fold hydrolase
MIYNSGDTRDLDQVIDYIYSDFCLDSNGNQTRHITGVGISLGASMLANYAARKGKKNPLSGQVGVSCHFDSKIAFLHMRNYMFGFYDYFLGMCLLI